MAAKKASRIESVVLAGFAGIGPRGRCRNSNKVRGRRQSCFRPGRNLLPCCSSTGSKAANCVKRKQMSCIQVATQVRALASPEQSSQLDTITNRYAGIEAGWLQFQDSEQTSCFCRGVRFRRSLTLSKRMRSRQLLRRHLRSVCDRRVAFSHGMACL